MLQAQSEKKAHIVANLRLRYEYLNGYNYKYFGSDPKAGTTNDMFVLSKIKTGLHYDLTKNCQLGISIQDSRAYDWSLPHKEYYVKSFGLENNPQEDYLELHEAYVLYSNSTQNFLVTLGRQIIVAEDERIFAEASWKNSGKWLWDGVHIKTKIDKSVLDFFCGLTVLSEPDMFSFTHRYGYYGSGLTGRIFLLPWIQIEPITAFKKNYNGESEYKTQENIYLGIGIVSDQNSLLSYKLRWISRIGSQTDTLDQDTDISGYGLQATLEYKPSLNCKPSILMEYVKGTGDNPVTSDVNESFDGVYGGAFKFYGRMGIMDWNNMHQVKISSTLTLKKNIKMIFETHSFFIDQNISKWKGVPISATNTSNFIGNEIDIIFQKKVYKYLECMTGLSFLRTGDLLKEATSSNENVWFTFFQISLSYL